jgi:CDP-diacylglycerol pyrophosphatase
MAINSARDRSQDQFHIHIDCVRPQVADSLSKHIGAIGDSWEEFPFDLAGHRYSAMRVSSTDLRGVNPFRLLTLEGAKGGHDIASRTLVVVGAAFGKGRDGFVLLSDRVNVFRWDFAHGEDLLDHSCAVAASTT